MDKTGPTTGAVIIGEVATVGQLPALLEGVRNEPQNAVRPGTVGQQDASEPGVGAPLEDKTACDGEIAAISLMRWGRENRIEFRMLGPDQPYPEQMESQLNAMTCWTYK